MSLAVAADNSRAVNRENEVVVAERRVVDKLVVGALQEGRINRENRPHSL